MITLHYSSASVRTLGDTHFDLRPVENRSIGMARTIRTDRTTAFAQMKASVGLIKPLVGAVHALGCFWHILDSQVLESPMTGLDGLCA